jgi:hypothetical protein
VRASLAEPTFKKGWYTCEKFGGNRKMSTAFGRLYHPSISRISIALFCALSVTLAGAAHGQQQGGPESGTKQATAGTGPSSPAPKLSLTDGAWSGKADFDSRYNEFSFAIKNNLFTGTGKIPLHLFCKDAPTGPVTMSMDTSISEDFSNVMRISDDGSFSTSTPIELNFKSMGMKIKIVVKGTFLTGSSASGSISTTSNKCKSPMESRWEAVPKGSTAQ